MAHIYPARTADTSLSTGTGAIVVSGLAPADSMRTFNEVLAIGDTVFLGVAHRDEDEWEEGKYTYSGTNRFVRTEIHQSSNDGAPVDYSAGIKDVWATVPSRTVKRAEDAITDNGVAEVDFGAWPGAPETSLAITGLAEIEEDSVIIANVTARATDDHSADEHWVDPPTVVAGNIVVHQGFTIYATGGSFYGKYSVAWAVR